MIGAYRWSFPYWWGMLLWLLAIPVNGVEREPLPPEQAFPLQITAIAPDRLQAEWRIAQGHYLYQSKLRFRVTTEGVDLGSPILPTALVKQDEFFGQLAIYRGKLTVEIPLHFLATPPGTIQITSYFQGCSDDGICYPPQTQTLAISLPSPVTPSSASKLPSPTPLAALAKLGQRLGLAPATPSTSDILEPDQAFPLLVEVLDATTLGVTWNIAPGCYLYRNKMTFQVGEAPGISLGTPAFPTGQQKEDEFLGQVEVYHNPVQVRLPVQRPPGGSLALALTVSYQGCADGRICYPPQSKTIAVTLPPLGMVATTTNAISSLREQAPLAGLAEQDRIAATLAGGNIGLVLMSFFGFGLLLAFTPCVFPMIPILSSLIVGQGQHLTTRRAFLLSLVYVVAMALTYAGAGVVAGLVGENLQAAFQNPWILLSFSLVFVLLALSMFGFYELQLPSGLQTRLAELSNRQQGGSLLGVGVMGLLSALIVGPCVAPPLAGALIYIGQTGDGWLGGIALFAMGLGMGAPLLFIGTSAGRWLPRAGNWMNTVKAVFGVLLLAVPLWLLERLLPAGISLGLWAALFIVSAVYLGAVDALPSGSSGWLRLWKGLGLVILLQGGLMLLGAASGGTDPLQPLYHLKPVAPTTSQGTKTAETSFRRVTTVEEWQRALTDARGKPVLLDFYADWCVECRRMAKYTFPDDGVQQALAGVTLLQADVTANNANDKALLRHFGILGPPAILLFAPDGQEYASGRVVGFMDGTAFIRHLKQFFPAPPAR